MSGRMMEWGLFLLLVISAGCYPYPDNNAIREDLDIVITSYQDSVDFTQYKTYYLYDSVHLLVDPGETVGSDDPFYNNGIDQVILNEIEVQMDALGYKRIDLFAFPDIGVSATALRVETVSYTSVPGWWWVYPGYGGGFPGYSGGSPTYWSGTYYAYESGSVVIDMRDFKIKDVDSTYVWTGYINGLLGETTTSTSERVKRSVESAFIQSRNFYPREAEK